ncbi:protein VTE6, chloroplastic, partial [Tanacetum coccineum]
MYTIKLQSSMSPDLGFVQQAINLDQSLSPTIVAAFLLGSLTWRGFGPSEILHVDYYFCIGTTVTKVKMAQKEAHGVAEKRTRECD